MSLLYNGLGRGLDHPHPSSAEVKDRVELYLYSPFGPSWPVLGRTLPFTFYSRNNRAVTQQLTLVQVTRGITVGME